MLNIKIIKILKMVKSLKAEKSNFESVKVKLDATSKLTRLLISEDPKENGWSKILGKF